MTDKSTEGSKTVQDQAPRGAWIVEALIVALILLLVGRSVGVAFTINAFAIALLLGTALTLAAHLLAKWLRRMN